jgi:hypothetical protein
MTPDKRSSDAQSERCAYRLNGTVECGGTRREHNERTHHFTLAQPDESRTEARQDAPLQAWQEIVAIGDRAAAEGAFDTPPESGAEGEPEPDYNALADEAERIAQNDYTIDGHYLFDGQVLLEIAAALRHAGKGTR